MSENRTWLNPADAGGTAYISAKIDDDVSIYRHTVAFDAELKVADCDRVVTLDFDTSKESTDEIRTKINRLYREVRRFRDLVVAACDEVDSTPCSGD